MGNSKPKMTRDEVIKRIKNFSHDDIDLSLVIDRMDMWIDSAANNGDETLIKELSSMYYLLLLADNSLTNSINCTIGRKINTCYSPHQVKPSPSLHYSVYSNMTESERKNFVEDIKTQDSISKGLKLLEENE
jgi:hypothetical protein